MPRNGSGTYALPSGQPVVTNTTISSTTFNALTSDLANALTTSVATDGQTAMGANLPMGGHKLTGLAAATGPGESLRYENLSDIQAQRFTAFLTGGTSTAYTITPSPVITAYAAYQSFFVDFHAVCGAAPTININGVGAILLMKEGADGVYVGLAAGDITLRHLSRVTLSADLSFALVERFPLPIGSIVGHAYAEYTANANLTTQIPADDTIPQNTEGTQIISVSFTPKSTANRVRLRFSGEFSVSALAGGAAAIFSSASANALAARSKTVGTADFREQLYVETEHVPVTTTAITYSVRVGPLSAVTLRMNGTSAAREFGGVEVATLVIEEIAA